MPAFARSLARKALVIALLAAPHLAFAEAPAAGTGKKDGGAAKKSSKPVVVVIKTSMGEMQVELDREKAPISVENFLKYVDKKHYDGTIFHRVINNFMIQGGGFDKDMKEKPTEAPIKNEAANGLKNLRGTVAMARTSVPDSATAQFYVNVIDNAFLDHRDPSPGGIGYAVFGKVIKGLEVVDKIKAVQTGMKNGQRDVPTTPVMIESIRRAK